MIVKNVEFQGSKVVSTNKGDIDINQNTSEMIVRKNGARMTVVNAQGFLYSDNPRRILVGAHPIDGHIINAITDPDTDVIDELSS